MWSQPNPSKMARLFLSRMAGPTGHPVPKTDLLIETETEIEIEIASGPASATKIGTVIVQAAVAKGITATTRAVPVVKELLAGC
jgi:hypothetical protein